MSQQGRQFEHAPIRKSRPLGRRTQRVQRATWSERQERHSQIHGDTRSVPKPSREQDRLSLHAQTLLVDESN